MKIIKIDKRVNEAICIPESAEDLWHLEKILQKGDTLFGHTDRKIKPTKEGEKALRINLSVELLVEDVHFMEYSESLKVNGIILSGKPEEYIELKSHQSIELRAGERVKFRKEKLPNWVIERMKKAENASASAKLLVVLLDDEEAELAFINDYSISKKATIKEKNKGKRFAQEKSTYFEEILEKIKLLEPKKLLLAGPGFVKDNLKKFIEDKKIKGFVGILTESTNSTGETGFKELLAEGKLEKAEKELRLGAETKTIEEFLALVAKGKAEYGKEKVTEALNRGAVEKLILSETYLMQNRKEAESILELAENTGAKTEIISSKNPQEKQIHGFGGIVCTLRYKLE
jgi:protein pelota